MNEKIKRELKRIKLDCIRLEKQGQLTDYGQGQLDIIVLLERWEKQAQSISWRVF